MGRFGAVVGLPFAIEGIAFFVEAIFLGIHLYGWERVHLLTGVTPQRPQPDPPLRAGAPGPAAR